MTVALLFQNTRAIMVQNLYLCSLIAPLFFCRISKDVNTSFEISLFREREGVCERERARERGGFKKAFREKGGLFPTLATLGEEE